MCMILVGKTAHERERKGRMEHAAYICVYVFSPII